MRMSILSFLVLTACAPAAAECDLDTTAADLAGSGATDCGTITLGGGEAEWTCAIGAWNAGTAFFLRDSVSGTDSVIEHAVVSDGSRVWLLWQDQYQSGPWDIDGNECIDPVVEPDADTGYDTLGCGSTEPEGNHYQVCGELCMDCGDPDPLPFNPRQW